MPEITPEMYLDEAQAPSKEEVQGYRQEQQAANYAVHKQLSTSTVGDSGDVNLELQLQEAQQK